jgi:hypothetical protein
MGAAGRAARRRAASALALALSPKRGELLGRRANPSRTRRLACFGEFHVFAQKTLAGVDGVASGLPATALSLAPSR